MSSHSFPKIDQKEYLKKYLSGDKTKKKKKDKKHKKSSKDLIKVKIIDDDVIDLSSGPQIDEELLLTGEDAPQIVGEYIEETPAEQKVPKWKSIVIKDEPEENESRLARNNEDDLWGRKTSKVRIKRESSNRTPDNSPRRRRRKSSSSPPRRQRKSASPTRSSKKDKMSAKSRDSNGSPDRRPKVKIEPLSPLQHSGSGDASSSRRRRNSDQSPPRRKQDSSPARNGRKSKDSSPRRERNPMGKRTNQMPDNSPPRRRINSSYTPPKTNRHVSRSPDNSPPRRRNNFQRSPVQNRFYSTAHNSPPRCTRNFDQSPIRQNKSSDFRPATRHRRDSTSRGRSPDQSPPRRRQNNDQRTKYRDRKNSDQSPPRSRRHSSDVSPPRNSKSKNRTETPDYSPPRKNRKASDPSPPPRRRRHSSDVSPPRNSKNRTETPDYSPPRKNRKASDPSPPPRRRRNSDQSPPRRHRKPAIEERVKQEKRTPDFSPPPARQSRWENPDSEKSQSPPPSHKPKPGKTLEGKKAGLQNAQSLQNETKERRIKEDILYETMSSSISGRNAEVQMRSTGRKGRRAREAADEDPEERRRKAEHEEKKKQQYDRWGKGLKQIEDHKNRIIQQEYESSKPLARYADDEDLEQHLREQERAEDPMLEYMRQKRKEKDKQSGKPEIPRYNGPYPENRFGIRPGYRWDGVDRSNGYEKKYFAVQNEKQARQVEAYKYSVEDM